MSENKCGRPPKYKSKEEIQEKIDAYFTKCEGEPLIIDGEPYIDKNGNPIFINRRPPTITGLALALGFNTRKSLIDYQDKDEFVNTIMRAKARVECYAEERLFDKEGANGAKFSLANNFDGWRERQQIEADVKSEININIELTDED